MSNYTQITFFAPKDALLSGNPAKLIKGADVDPELAAIAAAIASKYDGTNFAFANPSGTVGLVAVNGSSTNPMRSDAAPALSQAIVPTWTATHTFNATSGAAVAISGLNLYSNANLPASISGQLALVGTSGSPVGGRLIIGDGSGWHMKISKRTGSVTTDLVDFADTGNVTVSAPSSGTTLALNGLNSPGTITLTVGGRALITGSATNNGSELDITNTDASGGSWRLGDGVSVSAGTFAFYNGTNSRLTGSITGNGNWVIPAPGSGIALQVTGLSNQNAAWFIAGSTTSQSFGPLISAGTNASDYAILIQNQARSTNFFGVSGVGAISMGPANNSLLVSGTTGAVSVNAPSSGTALTATGVANSYAVQAAGSSTSGQSFGLNVTAGTTSADAAMQVTNQSGSLTAFKVRGDGVVFGNDGTNLFELGYKDAPINTQAGSYTAVVSDRDKTVNHSTNGSTHTVPANVFSAGNVYSIRVPATVAITVAQGASLTLNWAGTTSTGSRTLTGEGVATVLFLSATQATIMGVGLS